ncbi:hypothetical protein J3A83DRAFT_3499784 [Scleroderma citrinum]
MMTTTLGATVIDIPAATASSHHHHAGATDERGREVCSVRFDSQCVVIPEPTPRSRRPRLVTKTYSVPLWKRRGSLSGSQPTSPDPDIPCPEDHVVLKLPVPRLQTRIQSPPRSVDPPLTPCLVHRSPVVGSTTNIPGSPTAVRRTSGKSSISPTHADLVTVPLRPCCAACQEITDAARLQGDAWTERFSRAANNRRSMSADSQHRTITVAGSAAAASFGSLARGVPISVDEVDKRRRSIDVGLLSDIEALCPSDTTMAEERPNCFSVAPSNGVRPPLLSPIRVPQLVTHQEANGNDEEDQLFPLPSPKRTPCSSAAPSPTASSSSLQISQPHRSSSNSPAHGPSRFLAPPPAASTSSLSLPRTLECSYSDLTDEPPRNLVRFPHVIAG